MKAEQINPMQMALDTAWASSKAFQLDAQRWQGIAQQSAEKFQQETLRTADLTRALNDLLNLIYETGGEVGPSQQIVRVAEKVLATPVNVKSTYDCAWCKTDDCPIHNINGVAPATDEHRQGVQRVPYPVFCLHPDKCAGKSYCPRDPCCCD